MGKFYDEIPEHYISWIQKQKLFWVSTAPLSGSGHVNCSPKSADGAFVVVDQNHVRYVDFTGSGNETISHLYEPGNGRITITFCAFEGAPLILRLFGKGTVTERLLTNATTFASYLPPSATAIPPGTRAVIDVKVHKVGSSCGFSVPLYNYVGERDTLLQWAKKKEAAPLEKEEEHRKEGSGPEEPKAEEGNGKLIRMEKGQKRPARNKLEEYWAKTNATSLDGLPGLKMVSRANKGDVLHLSQIADHVGLLSMLLAAFVLGAAVSGVAILIVARDSVGALRARAELR